MSALEKTFITPEQYLELERKAEFKSEYYAGEMFAMAGGTSAHNIIGVNISGLLWSQLLGKPCTTFNYDMKVEVDPIGLYAYPDVMVICGEILYVDGKHDLLANPTVIVKVLSPSTEAYDRGEKWEHYRRLASLTDYLLVSQDKMLVEHFTRQPNNQWLLSDASGSESEIELTSLACRLPLASIYNRVALDPNKAALSIRRLQA